MSFLGRHARRALQPCRFTPVARSFATSSARTTLQQWGKHEQARADTASSSSSSCWAKLPLALAALAVPATCARFVHSEENRAMMLRPKRELAKAKASQLVVTSAETHTLEEELHTLEEELHDIDEKMREELVLERAVVRLDGLGTYSVISALNMGAALALMAFVRLRYDSWLNSVLSIMCLSGIACSMFSGSYTTVIFALVHLYSKTAIGLNVDEGYHAFLEETARHRTYAFVSFIVCLNSFIGSFAASLVLLVQAPWLQLAVLAVTVSLCLTMAYHINEIVTLATTCIFTPLGTGTKADAIS
eukprot:TRINITY_DN25709_c0_g1_i1.p1 TRINITY_DN25709_c0_g1~~TRINITY_DN25709_c0_g1_i1.p1  ORF type:complete len:320 (+),score=59.15 TRINITY_DN25709_c0_g1_i1:49-960(+)